jgi:hypothetical protein
VAIEARQVDTVRMLVNNTHSAPDLQDALDIAVITGVEELVAILLLSKKMYPATLAAGKNVGSCGVQCVSDRLAGVFLSQGCGWPVHARTCTLWICSYVLVSTSRAR